MPDFEVTFEGVVGAFQKCLLIRCLREDRSLQDMRSLIEASTSILGPKYTQPTSDTLACLFDDTETLTPVIYLLSSGADPTQSLENFAKKKSVTCNRSDGRRTEYDCAEGDQYRAYCGIMGSTTKHALRNSVHGVSNGPLGEVEKERGRLRVIVSTFPHNRTKSKFPIRLLRFQSR